MHRFRTALSESGSPHRKGCLYRDDPLWRLSGTEAARFPEQLHRFTSQNAGSKASEPQQKAPEERAFAVSPVLHDFFFSCFL